MSWRQRKFLDISLFVPAKMRSKCREVTFELLHELSRESSGKQRTKFAHFACITFAQYCISNLLSFCSSSYSLQSCSNKFLQVPRSKLKSYGDRRFSIAGPKLWNSLPASLRNADLLNSFKKHLKTFLFQQAFSWFITRFVSNFYVYTQ